jgi:hypothetical protein
MAKQLILGVAAFGVVAGAVGIVALRNSDCHCSSTRNAAAQSVVQSLGDEVLTVSYGAGDLGAVPPYEDRKRRYVDLTKLIFASRADVCVGRLADRHRTGLGVCAPVAHERATAGSPSSSGDRAARAASAALFGALPTSLSAGARRSPRSGAAFADLAALAPSLNSIDAARPQLGAAASSLIEGPGVDDLASTPAGRQNVALDGPADEPQLDRADFDVDAKSLPPSAPQSSRPALPPINGHPRIIDASVGTPLDPLQNKTWDLNSPKVVPPLN